VVIDVVMNNLDPDVLKRLAEDFITDATASVARMRDILQAGGQRAWRQHAGDARTTDPGVVADVLRSEAHKIKGTAGFCGFPSLAEVAGRFEAYMIARQSAANPQDLCQFIDILDLFLTLEEAAATTVLQVVLDWLPPSQPVNLRPLRGDYGEAAQPSAALLVCHETPSTGCLGQRLSSMGVDVAVIADPSQALKHVINTPPQMIFVTVQLRDMSGLEFVRLLSAMDIVNGSAIGVLSDRSAKDVDVSIWPKTSAVIDVNANVQTSLAAFVKPLLAEKQQQKTPLSKHK
jgi:HPt (histidine-containing phosphotransfer) domain-containing protein/CheY-like chemotaxis protein